MRGEICQAIVGMALCGHGVRAAWTIRPDSILGMDHAQYLYLNSEAYCWVRVCCYCANTILQNSGDAGAARTRTLSTFSTDSTDSSAAARCHICTLLKITLSHTSVDRSLFSLGSTTGLWFPGLAS